MGRIESEPIRVFCPAFTGVFVGREAAQGLEPLCEVVGSQEGGDVFSKLIVAVVVIASDRSFFERAVHALNLAVGPGMLRLCEPVIDVIAGADEFEPVGPEEFSGSDCAFDLGHGRAACSWGCEVKAVVCQDGVDFVWDGCDQIPQKACGYGPCCFFMQLREGEFGCAVYGHEEVKLTLFGSDLGNVDMEIADGIFLEGLLSRLIAFHLRQPADAMTLRSVRLIPSHGGTKHLTSQKSPETSKRPTRSGENT